MFHSATRSFGSVAVVTAVALHVHAVGFHYDFQSLEQSTHLNHVGDATLTVFPTGVIKYDVTPDEPNKKGAVWHEDEQDLSLGVASGFTSTFRYRISDNDTAADGIVLVIQDESNTFVGDHHGGDLGYHEVEPGLLAVELDTVDNSNFPGFENEGVGIAVHSSSPLSSQVPICGTWEFQPVSGKRRDVTVRYHANDTPTLTVSVDAESGETVFEKHSCEVDLTPLLPEDGRAFVGVSSATGLAFSRHELWALSYVPWDQNSDGSWNVMDIVDLCSVAAAGSNQSSYDITGDGAVDNADVDVYLGAVNRLRGDADFDGAVTFPDFLTLSTNFGLPGNWSEGDFDCDGQVAFPDFLLLSSNFGAVAASVPEPTSNVILLLTLGYFYTRIVFRSRQ